MNQKGTITLEYILTTLILLIIVILIASLTLQQYINVEETQNRKEARLLVNDIAGIINNLNTKTDGYTTTYTMPELINNETYILKINSTDVQINSHYQLASSKIQKAKLNLKYYILKPRYEYVFSIKNKTIFIEELKQ